MSHLPQLLEVTDLERLDKDRSVPAAVAVTVQRFYQRLFERQADALELGRVLGFGVDTNVAGAPGALPFRKIEHLLQGWDCVSNSRPPVNNLIIQLVVI
jgi:hypothetical protein